MAHDRQVKETEDSKGSITFVKEKMYDETCAGGVETRHCSQPAIWYELFDGWQILARLCNGCKHEVETYVLNQAL